VESLCHAALARSVSERAAFLVEACGDDAALRAEVESLLVSAESSPSFLETPIDAASRPSLVGRQLGAYRIDAPIGAGGMGEVYRAKDTRLGRDVALKILPVAFAADPQRRARFEREARAVAALNHPNICTIHDVGHEQGIDFLVMELVDGESLGARLAQGALPLDEALARAIEIADALDKAHGQGIIHRDLKPGNVMLATSRSGKAPHVKLLDFGLARIVPSGAAAAAVGADTSPMTETGAVLGTVQYMAPEQIEGQPADARTDIFAFGALFYEMLTGRRAFEGASTAALMAAILREKPPMVHPREVGRVVRRCLAKDPLRRYQSARDLLNDLEEVQPSLDASGYEMGGVLSAQATRQRPTGRRVGWFALGFLAAAIAAAGYLGTLQAPAPAPSYRPLTFQRGVVTGARFSPDGQTIYYSASWGADPPRVYMTRLEGTGSVKVDLPPATLLSVSSKGELALLLTEGRNSQVSSGTLARASALGGTPRPLRDDISDADWTPDGEKLVVRRNEHIEFADRVLVPSVAGMPRISPRGDRIAYIAEDGVRVVDLEGRSVLDHKVNWTFGLAWRPDGREIWFTGTSGLSEADRAIYALSLSGEQRMVAAAPGSLTIHDIAADGKRALVTTGAGWYGIQVGSADRASESTLDLFGRSFLVGLSADGKLALIDEARVGRGLYLRSTDGSQTIRLSDDRGLALSPDGRLALTSRANDPSHLYLISTGTQETQQLALDSNLRPHDYARWSADGRQIFIALVQANPAGDSRRIYRLDATKSWRPVTPAGVGDEWVVSPNGEFVAAPDRAGTVTVYPVDGGEPRTLAEERGIPIHWSSDGRWLYLATMGSFRAQIYRRELASGRVESWRELALPDPAGVFSLGGIYLSGDGRAYAYNYSRSLHVLYLLEGLQ
ncbi:MAG TPA: protein kinase, partial [Vicinamibacterales bacterium]|nr:protein kinase [Vicinamibacterales bacterium]